MERLIHAHGASGLGRFSVLWLLLFAFASILPLATAYAAEPELPVDSITVRWRPGVVPDGAASLPEKARALLDSALGFATLESDRQRDGAFVLHLPTPLAIDHVRAAINRLRMLPDILYASINDPRQSGQPRVAAVAATDASQSAPVRRLIVKFRDEQVSLAADRDEHVPPAWLNRLTALAGQPVSHERAMSGGAFVVNLFHALSPGQAKLLARLLESDPAIEYADPDLLKEPMATPSDPLYTNQWHYQSPPSEIGGLNLPPALDVTTGALGIVVAVIDTGYPPGHPDLAGRFIGGYDFIADALVANDGNGRDNDPSDPGDWITSQENASGYFKGCGRSNSSWHGTHVSGTIGAATNNGIGVAGINRVSKLLVARVLGKCGGYTSDIADAIRWSVGIAVPGVPPNPNPARVLNLSLGGYACDANGQNCSCDTTSQNAINAALAANAVVVVAAGNSNRPAVEFSPANCNGAITVAATGRQGQRASYSNHGALVEISAPGGSDGEYVLSTLNSGTRSLDPNGYNYVGYAGTSMATPHVSGVASLMLSVNSSLTPSQVTALLQSSARAFPTGTVRDCTTALCGAGIVDAGAAVLAARPGLASTTTTVTSSGSPAMLGATVTFTATVTGSSPTGTVAFTSDGSTLSGCSASALTGSGNGRTAKCSTNTLAAGVHSITATYSGDAANAASTSAAFSQVINAPAQTATTTTLASSANPAILGSTVTFTATVNGSSPTGTVNFTADGTSIGGCSAAGLTGSGNTRTAGCSTSSLSGGTHSIVASYGGDSGNLASSSTALNQVINATTSLNVSPTSIAAGGTVTVSWSGIASPTSSDWIGLYAQGAANTAYRDWMYVSCSKTAGSARASGSCAFVLPASLASGTYEFRLLANNGLNVLATSTAITVTGGATLSVSPTSIAAGGTLTATWSGIAAPSATDWTGLYASGAANTSFIDWIYVSCSKTAGSARASGSCPFVLPTTLAAGSYELRLFSNDGYVALARSQAITVTP